MTPRSATQRALAAMGGKFTALNLSTSLALRCSKWRRGAPIVLAGLIAAMVTVAVVAIDVRANERSLSSNFASLTRDFGAHIESTTTLGARRERDSRAVRRSAKPRFTRGNDEQGRLPSESDEDSLPDRGQLEQSRL
jgi:hypothetical protein